jgi:hypothetical protein
MRADCCSVVSIGTKRIDGRLTASQIASASTTSFLLRFTGFHIGGRHEARFMASAINSRAGTDHARFYGRLRAGGMGQDCRLSAADPTFRVRESLLLVFNGAHLLYSALK